MAKTPQSFAKRQRERRKQQKREEKLERRLIRNEEKRLQKLIDEGGDPSEIRSRQQAIREREEWTL